MVTMPDLEGTSFPIPILNSDSEDDLVHALRLSVRRTKVAETSLSEVDVIRFRNLKRVASAAIPPTEAVLPALWAPHQPLGHR